MRRVRVCMALLAAVAMTACSGGNSDAAAPTTTVPPTTAVPVVGNDQAHTPFCRLARTYTEKYSTILASANDPVKLRAATTDTEAAIRQAQAAAPREIKSDVTVVAKTARQLLAALEKNDFDLGRTSEITKLQEPDFRRSVANLNRYARAHCGVG